MQTAISMINNRQDTLNLPTRSSRRSESPIMFFTMFQRNSKLVNPRPNTRKAIFKLVAQPPITSMIYSKLLHESLDFSFGSKLHRRAI